MNWVKAFLIFFGVIAGGAFVSGFIMIAGPRGLIGVIIAGILFAGLYLLKRFLDEKDRKEDERTLRQAETIARRLESKNGGRLFVEQPRNVDGTPFRGIK